ncbi:MAG: cellulase family glycosylhydrolase [Polyangiaceae bacterium]|nr:cellulase family glycosylhydrolase [Polyangiaceae bacterium]
MRQDLWTSGSLLGLPALLATTGCLKLAQPAAPPPPKYMNASGELEELQVAPTDVPSAYFVADGKPFCFQGTNNYYINFKSHRMVDDVFKQMPEMNLKVMRTWAFLDIGSLDHAVESIDGMKEKVYFQYWDPAAGAPAYHEGPDGFERLDYVLHRARTTGVRMIMVLTNNWKDFGGMDQYLIWYGLKSHYQFFTDERVKKAYKDYVAHLINRVNTIDGTAYREDPAIFAWELANEPRCKNYGRFDDLSGCDPKYLTAWADEMSAFVRTLDQHHMVAVGDEGFFDDGGKHWTHQGKDGVDHVALTSLPNIDFATYHLYPDNWSTGVKFGYQWIVDHVLAAQKIGKPTVLEEYGTIVKSDKKTLEITYGWERRKTAYINFNNLHFLYGGNAAMFWMLADQDDYLKALYPDYDGYTVYNGLPTGELLQQFAAKYGPEAPACRFASQDLPPEANSSPFVTWRPPPGRMATAGTTPVVPTPASVESASHAPNG